jgi:hypothetical protein
MPKTTVPRSEIEVLLSIDERLRQLTALTALTFTAGKKQLAAIEELAKANLNAKAISDMTGWPTSTVAPAISKSKGKSPKGNS